MQNPRKTRPPHHCWAVLTACLTLTYLAQAEDPEITTQPTNQVVSLGGTAQFSAVASTADYPLTYQWQHTASSLPDGFTNLAGSTTVQLEVTNVLKVANVVAEQGGDYYRLVVRNAIGNSATSQVATLTVDPTFTQVMTGVLVEDTVGSWTGSWVDYDGDGKMDLSVAPGTGSSAVSALYHNEGSSTFRKVTTNSIAQTHVQAFVHVWADYDNDGKVDLFVPNYDSMNDMLFHNNGNSSFTRITTGHPVIDAASSLFGMWDDYNRDGFLDLFVTTGENDILYRSNGDGTFRKMTVAEVGPVVNDLIYTDYTSWADVDNDGWPELCRTVDNKAGGFDNQVYHLDSQGKFYLMDIGEMKMGTSGYTCITWADYDNDGYLDAAASATTGPVGLYRNLAGQGFTNVAASAFTSSLTNCYPGQAVDCDNDGWQDLIIYPAASSSSAPPPTLYRNNGDGTFSPKSVGGPTTVPVTSLCWGDYDNDGFQDALSINGVNVRNSLFRHNGNANHWLKVRLDGRASNRSGIGAKVRVQATIGGRTFWQMREISTQSFGIENGLLAQFGLGDATNVTTLRIEWPSGIVQEWKDVPVDQHLTKVESQGGSLPAPEVTASSRSADGTFHATVTNTSQAKLLHVLEASTDLTKWSKIQVRTNLVGTMEFTDSSAAKAATRFYRVVVP